MLLLLCPLAGAQVYVNLTAQQVRIDSLLPVFSWQKSLGVIYADSIYDVCIDYPEFIDMSAEDIRRYHAITSEPLSTHHLSLRGIGVRGSLVFCIPHYIRTPIRERLFPNKNLLFSDKYLLF